nr:Deleted in lung and esophageal cancer protein 1 [Polyrhizophydium stewartii]
MSSLAPSPRRQLVSRQGSMRQVLSGDAASLKPDSRLSELPPLGDKLASHAASSLSIGTPQRGRSIGDVIKAFEFADPPAAQAGKLAPADNGAPGQSLAVVPSLEDALHASASALSTQQIGASTVASTVALNTRPQSSARSNSGSIGLAAKGSRVGSISGSVVLPAVPTVQVDDEPEDADFSLRRRLARKLEELDVRVSVAGISRRKIDAIHAVVDNSRTYCTWRRLQNSSLEDVFDEDTEKLRERIDTVMAECDAKLEDLRDIREEMLDAKRRAEDDEREHMTEAFRGFDPKYQSTVLPPTSALLKLNTALHKQYGLITFSTEDETEDDEAINLKRQLKNEQLVQRIRRFSFPRTDTRLRRLLFSEQKNRVLEIDAAGVLEVEYDPNSKGPGAGTAEACVPDAAAVHVRRAYKVEYGDEEIRILNRMNNRIYYLRNPRFPVAERFKVTLPENSKLNVSTRTPGSSFTSQSLFTLGRSISAAPPTPRAEQHESQILAEPSTVYFGDYVPYCSYTQKLTIRNTASVAHRFRVSTGPPYKYSQFFSCELVHCPKDNDGLVAPGLACEYAIRFHPNSYADFHQALLISTEMGDSFTVSVIAKRQPPELTLPPVLDCGPCRAGHIAVRNWDFLNRGGPARFLIMPPGENLDPFEVFDKIGAHNHVKPTAIRSGPFEVYPSYFSLGSNEFGRIVVHYSPQDVHEGLMDDDTSSLFSEAHAGEVVSPSRMDSIVLKVACDNCQILELPLAGRAERPSVRIVRVERHTGEVVHSDELPEDELFDLIHDFGDQNPHGVSSSLVVARNRTHLRLPFRWAQSDNPRNIHNELEDLTFEKNMSIQITPASGWLEPNSETTFRIEFCPETVRPYDIVAELLLVQDSESKVGHRDAPSLLGDTGEEKLLALRLKGRGVPYEAYVNTKLLCIPYILRSGEKYSSRVTMTNLSVWSLDYEWLIENIDESAMDVEISEQTGTLGSQACAMLSVRLVGGFPSRVNGALVCRTAHGLGPTLRISIIAEIGLPLRSLAFDADAIDFGLLALGEKKTVQVPLVNSTRMTMTYELRATRNDDRRAAAQSEHPDAQSSAMDSGRPDCYLIYRPSRGTIAAGATHLIDLTYIPTWYQRLNGTLEVRVLAMSPPGAAQTSTELEPAHLPPVTASAVEMVSIVQTPRIDILNPHQNFSCFYNVPVQIIVTLTNLTMLSAKFRLRNLNTDTFRATFTPDHGELAGGTSVDVKVELVFFSVGEHKNLRMFGDVEGMVENDGQLLVIVDAEVRPLEVSFRVIENEKALEAHAVIKSSGKTKKPSNRSAALRFDFGTTCPIFAIRARTLRIRNHSAMVSPFKIWFEKYTPTAQIDTVLDDSEDFDAGAIQEADARGARGGLRAGPFGSEPVVLTSATSDATQPNGMRGGSSTKGERGREHKRAPAAMASSTPTPLLLRPTKANKIGFSSKAGQGYIDNIKKVRHMIQRMQTLLSDGRGAAFHASPSQGVIQPWGEMEVRVTSYNNLVGLYEDYLVCEIGDWVQQRMPVRLGVVGTPVKFTGPHLVTKAKQHPGDMDRVNFGARVINPRWGGGDGVRVGLSAPQKPDPTGGFAAVQMPSSTGLRANATSHSVKDPSLPEAFTKLVIVENQSPRDIVLNWNVYIRHAQLHERSFDDLDSRLADDVISSRYLVRGDEMGILEVSPNSLTIPAFKSSTMTCIYRSAMLGNFDALVLADVGYMEPDGSVRYEHKRHVKRDDAEASAAPGVSAGQQGESIKIRQLDSVAKLHIQARCIEPKLSLDVGSRLRIKQTIRPVTMDVDAASMGRSVIAFLKNNSDAVCSFTLEALPTRLFSVIGASRFLKKETPSGVRRDARTQMAGAASVVGGTMPAGAAAAGAAQGGAGPLARKKKGGMQEDLHMYELKQTEQLLITVRYSGTPPARRQSVSVARALALDGEGSTPLASMSLRNTPGYAGSLMTGFPTTNPAVSTPSDASPLTPGQSRPQRISRGTVQFDLAAPELCKTVITDTTASTEYDPVHGTVRTAQQFRTVATGELRITFSNGMTQSIPIVVEEPIVA